MADISAIKLPSGNTYDIKDSSSGYITGMTILSYGSSTWDNFIEAYNANNTIAIRDTCVDILQTKQNSKKPITIKLICFITSLISVAKDRNAIPLYGFASEIYKKLRIITTKHIPL